MSMDSTSRPGVPLREGFLDSHLERRPARTNQRINEAVVRDLSRDERRAGIQLLRGCSRLSAARLGLDAARGGRPRKHNLGALQTVLLLRYFFGERKSALVSRETIVLKVTRKHTRPDGSTERIPNSLGLELGLTEGQSLSAADLDRAMLDLAGSGVDILNVALEHLTRWMRRLHPALGQHLVYDSMPIASFSTLRDSRERDGGWAEHMWDRIVADLALDERGIYSDFGPCKANYHYRLKGSETGDVATFYGRRLHAIADEGTGFPLAVALTPASFSEQTVFRECLLPRIWLLMAEGLIRPVTFTSDAGLAGLPATRAVLGSSIDPRIAQRSSLPPINLEWQHGELVLLSDGTLAIHLGRAWRRKGRGDDDGPDAWEETQQTERVEDGHGGGRRRRKRRKPRQRDKSGVKYVLVNLYQPMRVLPERGEDGAIRYACTRIRQDDVALGFLSDDDFASDQPTGQRQLGGTWTCGADHQTQPCRADPETGALFEVSCPDWETSLIIGPQGFSCRINANSAYAPFARMGGPALTPPTPRREPNPRADFGLARNAVEEIWRVLRQYFAMYKSQAWTGSAALDVLLGVVARVAAGIANIRRLSRLHIRDGVTDPERRSLERRKVYGLTVERDRRRSSTRAPCLDPPWSIIHLVAY